MVYYTTICDLRNYRSMDEKYRKIDPGLPEKLGGNLKTFEQVYESSFDFLENADLSDVSARSGADLKKSKKLNIKYFGKDLTIDIGSRKIHYGESGNEIDIFSATIILHYIKTSDGTALTGNWISYRELPDGMFYFRTIPGVLEPLLEKYGDSFDAIAEKVYENGGEKSSDFKNGVIIYPFPYFPIMLILEEKSEEFEADIRALFDSSASHYMKTDIVKVMLINLVKILSS